MTVNHDGGAKLKVILKDLKRRLGSAYAHVGVFDPEVVRYASINEFGDPGHNIPPRPFLAATFMLRHREWLNIILHELKKADARSRDIVKEAGKYAVGNIVETLENAPSLFIKNADVTVAKKGFDYPLKETGRLRKKITLRVRKDPW